MNGVVCLYRDEKRRIRVRYGEDQYFVEQYNWRHRVYECASQHSYLDSAISVFSSMVREFIAAV